MVNVPISGLLINYTFCNFRNLLFPLTRIIPHLKRQHLTLAADSSMSHLLCLDCTSTRGRNLGLITITL